VLDIRHLPIVVDPSDEHASLLGKGAFPEASHVGSHNQCLRMLQLAADSGIKPWIMLLPMTYTKKAMQAVKKKKKKKCKQRFALTQDLKEVEVKMR
jgi:alcohol dehydrogenase (NADP+)